MLRILEEKREEIADLCRALGVRRLEVFGSAARGECGPDRDVDFFYEMGEGSQGLAERFFTLHEQLETLLGMPVDLVSAKDARNPYFLRVANRDRRLLYDA